MQLALWGSYGVELLPGTFIIIQRDVGVGITKPFKIVPDLEIKLVFGPYSAPYLLNVCSIFGPCLVYLIATSPYSTFTNTTLFHFQYLSGRSLQLIQHPLPG